MIISSAFHTKAHAARHDDISPGYECRSRLYHFRCTTELWFRSVYKLEILNSKSLALCPEARARGLIDTSPSFLQRGDSIKSVRIDENVSLLSRKNKCSVILHHVHSAPSLAHAIVFTAALNIDLFKTDDNKYEWNMLLKLISVLTRLSILVLAFTYMTDPSELIVFTNMDNVRLVS